MAARKPNVLLNFVDNQPASMKGCYGNDDIFTPHLDALASRGVLFRNAFARTPCARPAGHPCSPA